MVNQEDGEKIMPFYKKGGLEKLYWIIMMENVL